MCTLDQAIFNYHDALRQRRAYMALRGPDGRDRHLFDTYVMLWERALRKKIAKVLHIG